MVRMASPESGTDVSLVEVSLRVFRDEILAGTTLQG
jgi:hypothetical protein